MLITHKTELCGEPVDFTARSLAAFIGVQIPHVVIHAGSKHVVRVLHIIHDPKAAHIFRLFVLCRMNLDAWQFIGKYINEPYLSNLQGVA